MRRSIILLLAALLVFGLEGCSKDGSDGAPGATGDPGPAGPAGPPGYTEPTTAVETCVGQPSPTLLLGPGLSLVKNIDEPQVLPNHR